MKIRFAAIEGGTKITETFDAEKEYPEEAQQAGWQAILNNFARYVESLD